MQNRSRSDAINVRAIGSAGALVASRYRLGSLLGRGGHGEVWGAEDLLLGEEVALKLLHREFTDAARARREIAALRLVRLPGVVRLLDEGLEGACPFLVMELIRGARFPGAGRSIPCSWPALAPIAEAILETLARIHAEGVVHRDLKPENILVTADGRPVIVDFGLCFPQPFGADLEAGRLAGTPLYLAPEQIRGEAIGPWTDLYSLGLILYEALAGRLPHEADDLQELIVSRLSVQPEPLSHVAPEVPPEIAAAVDALLAVEADERPGSAADLLRIVRGPAGELDGAPAEVSYHRSQIIRVPSISAGLEASSGAELGPIEVASEAAKAAKMLVEAGHLRQAAGVLAEGLGALRTAEAHGEEGAARRLELLGLWTQIALFDRTPRALDRVLYEICLIEPRPAALSQLEALGRAALALAAGSERAHSMAEAVPPFEEPRLERARHDLRIASARRMSQERLDALLSEASQWAEKTGAPDARAALDGWLGRLRYQEGLFEEAAELHARSAEGEPWAMARVAALFHAAGAWMETFRLDAARRCAERALELAAACRNAHYEAKTRWLLRSIDYRSGQATEPDYKLVDAVADVGVPDLEALVCLTEAAVHLRGGDKQGSARLAERARRIWVSMGKQWAADLARSLGLASGPALLDGDARALAERAIQCPVPGIGIQMLGLLSMGHPGLREGWAPHARSLAEKVPRRFWRRRIDLLSVEEALAALGLSEAMEADVADPPFD